MPKKLKIKKRPRPHIVNGSSVDPKGKDKIIKRTRVLKIKRERY